MKLIRKKKYNVSYSDDQKLGDSSLERSLLEATKSTLINILEEADSSDKEMNKEFKEVKNVIKAIKEDINPKDISNIVSESTENVAEMIFSKTDRKYIRKRNYAASKISKFVTELGFAGAAKALTGGIMSAFASLSSIPYLGGALETLGEVVIKPSMLAIPGSLIIYTLVKRGLLDPIKYSTGKEKVKKILKEMEKETGCISIDNVDKLSEEISSIFVSGENNPVTKILEWVKTEMIKEKKAKNEEEAYEKIVEALTAENKDQSEK
ncbi:MAG: hypothetical protein QXS19_07375 [Candidatus Methanomethylicia archaeon]